MKWLRGRYSRDVIRDFVTTEGARRLPPRDRAYWALVSGAAISESPGGARPMWAGG